MVVDDKAEILLVDPESEGVRRHDHLELVGHEAVLRQLPVRSRHLSVIQANRVMLLEPLVQLLRLAHGGNVDDPDARCTVDDLA
jgi:hypothetical protein